MDEAGEENIYDINLLEVMLMVNDAWEAISATTIQNCWNHTGIQGNLVMAPKTPATVALGAIPKQDKEAWDLLKLRLGAWYTCDDWKPAFDAIFEAEDDTGAAITTINNLEAQATAPAFTPTPTPIPAPGKHVSRPSIPEVTQLETDLMNTVTNLQEQTHAHGPAPTLEELVDLIEEKEIDDLPYTFSGGDADILAAVRASEKADAIEQLEDKDEAGGLGDDKAELPVLLGQ
ncbi:hypothetical protein HWV62_40475 [Athelia sp. TMB]|nr:hypothetical protein HWV62_40475 [Athelia sp. TMB]